MANTVQQKPSNETDIEAQIEQRLDELKAIAIHEHIAPSEESESDFRCFIRSRILKRRPYIFLLESGNFRALWKNDQDEQIGLQFLGGRKVQYVIFARRSDPEMIVRSSGRDNIKGIERLIDAYDELREIIEA
jgi:hypothetical protein